MAGVIIKWMSAERMIRHLCDVVVVGGSGSLYKRRYFVTLRLLFLVLLLLILTAYNSTTVTPGTPMGCHTVRIKRATIGVCAAAMTEVPEIVFWYLLTSALDGDTDISGIQLGLVV